VLRKFLKKGITWGVICGCVTTPTYKGIGKCVSSQAAHYAWDRRYLGIRIREERGIQVPTMAIKMQIPWGIHERDPITTHNGVRNSDHSGNALGWAEAGPT
jgi:hypothetical protein